MSVPSVFESFNAKLLPTKQLVEDYVPSQHMMQFASRSHSILVGTRGSGKTTIMRMLQVEAVSIAKLRGAPEELLGTTYYGVYVPTDRMWAKQKDSYLEGAADRNLANLLVARLFSLHVLDCVLTSLTFRVTPSSAAGEVFGKVQLSSANEELLVRNLVELWELSPVLYTIPALRMAITRHISEITKTLSSGATFANMPTEKFPSLELGLRSSVSYINLALEENEGLWCFLFDELELAPAGTYNQLLELTRGGPTNIIFKLALAPYREDNATAFDQTDAFAGHDYNTVNLQAGERGLDFARALGDSLLRRKGFPGTIEGYFQEPEINLRTAVAEYASRDSSLAAYLGRNGIEIDSIEKVSDKAGGTLVRKIQKNVFLRSRIRSERGKAPRSPLRIFAGFSSFCRALEHNPRLLIGAFSRLITDLDRNNAFDEVLQLEVLSSIERKCSAQLGLQPIDRNRNGLRSVRDLIYRIAQTIRDREIGGVTFRPDYASMFTIRDSTSFAIREAVGIAQNMGMVVEEDVDIDDAVSEKRALRLSYLFSHRFSIPDIRGRIMPIERFISRIKRSNKVRPHLADTLVKALKNEQDDDSHQLEFF